MTTTRRDALTLSLAAAGGLALPAEAAAAPRKRAAVGAASRSARPGRGIDGQRIADQGNGRYLNPALAGDRPDPNVLKDGDDYYATFSSFEYYPGVPIWHSRDLVNWTPLTAALTTPVGVVWALDIAKHGGRYFIYIPALDPSDSKRPIKTWVIHAPSMAGPWSEPIDLKIDNLIDPGHCVGEDGKRYLFFNGGNRVQLADDGLSTVGSVQHVYNGWPIPDDYVIEGFALEGPKLLRKDGWFYMFSGQGGTAGPPTSHMVVVARSRSINGPWENCPHNPVVRTTSRNEPWWSRGHATPVHGPRGDWWLIYHGYENGMRTLGRQMLLEPIVWTADGWPKAMGGDLSRQFPKPVPGSTGPALTALSGFPDDAFRHKLTVFRPGKDYLDRAAVRKGTLTVAGQGTGPAESSPVLFVTGDRSYELTVEVEVEGAGHGGILLFYNEKMFCGLGFGNGRLHAYRIGQEERWPPGASTSAKALQLRLVNDENIVTFYYRAQGGAWTKERSFEVAGYNHNVLDGFLSLRPGFYSAGEGTARFRNLIYKSL